MNSRLLLLGLLVGLTGSIVAAMGADGTVADRTPLAACFAPWRGLPFDRELLQLLQRS
jgi:hypothetical protein